MTNNSSLTKLHSQFIAHLKLKRRSTHTILAYGKDIAQFIAHLHQENHHTPTNITPETISSFQDSLTDYTPKSISRKLNSIKTFCRFLTQNHHLTTNPTAAIVSPTLKSSPPRILTPLEYRALRDAARKDLRLSAVIELLLQTGLRIGELAHLQLQDINKSTATLTVRPYESHPARTVPLVTAAHQALDNYLKTRPRSSNQTVFITKTGRPFLIRNIRSAINRLFKAAGIPKATVNDLRHTFIATQIATGTPLNFIAQVAGHKRLSTTETYLKYIKPGPFRSHPQLEEL